MAPPSSASSFIVILLPLTLTLCLLSAAAEQPGRSLLVSAPGNASLSIAPDSASLPAPASRQRRPSACNLCRRYCPSLVRARRRARACVAARTHLQRLKVGVRRDRHAKRGRYFRFTVRNCFHNFCASVKTRDSCGLFRRARNWEVLKKALKRETAIARRARAQWRRSVRPRFRFKDYMQRRDAIDKHSANLKRVRALTLGARRDYERWRRFSQTRAFWKRARGVQKFREQARMYGVSLQFWKRLKSRLRLALRTSPQAVRNVAEETKRTLRMLARERREARRRRKRVGRIEASESWWVQETRVLRRRISELDALNKELRDDRLFLKRVGGGVRNLLNRIRGDVRARRVKVGCRPNAIGFLIGRYARKR